VVGDERPLNALLTANDHLVDETMPSPLASAAKHDIVIPQCEVDGTNHLVDEHLARL
jgi:hypothetical protein